VDLHHFLGHQRAVSELPVAGTRTWPIAAAPRRTKADAALLPFRLNG